MSGSWSYDAVIVGSGPNGLAAGITLARAGRRVKIYEAKNTPGGGTRSAELTLPGFLHDVCSAVHPMAVVSPFFLEAGLEAEGLNWIYPALALAHPLADGRAATLAQGRIETGGLGTDTERWRSLFAPWHEIGVSLFKDILQPPHIPRHPLAMAEFGLQAALSAQALAARRFRTQEAKALLAGIAGHSLLALEQPFSSASALALGLAAHVAGWPIAAGGSQMIAEALLRRFTALGGEIEFEKHIISLSQLPKSMATLLDVSADQLAALGGEALSQRYLQRLQRFRRGPGLFKVDWALSSAVPWLNDDCKRAGTIHVGGSLEEIASSEREVSLGRLPEKPFVLLSQPSLFDTSRCPEGRHILWGYCHVPFGSSADMTVRIENQIERFAPGFRDCVLERKTTSPGELERYNANYIGGDISSGAMDWPQIFKRPTSWFKPYNTPIHNVFLCSASTPPGPGVHGMCGYWAAKQALRALGS